MPIVFSGFSDQAYIRFDHYAARYVDGHLEPNQNAGIYQVIDPLHPASGGYFLYYDAGYPTPSLPTDPDFANFFALPMVNDPPAPATPPGSVDGKVVDAFPHGVIQGDGGVVDLIVGSDGVGDRLMGEAAFNRYHGGSGADTFIPSAKYAGLAGAHQGVSAAMADQFAYIDDFAGAGVAGGDFIALTGFKPATLHLEGSGSGGPGGGMLYRYSVQDMAGHSFNLTVNSLDGRPLGAGDFAFY